jgi:hypothetical protein
MKKNFEESIYNARKWIYLIICNPCRRAICLDNALYFSYLSRG